MENLDKLTSTGLPVFDLNAENLNRKDWAETTLGKRDAWPLALTCLVNTCILPIPHCAAIFWGSDLSIVHNLAWGKASGNLDGQGARASDSYSGEALSSLKAVLRGRTVKVASRFFLKHVPEHTPEAQLLLSTILDEQGTRQGVLAQLLENATVERYLPFSGLDDLARKNPVQQTKTQGTQQPRAKRNTRQVDDRQTQLFQRFAELLPNGLAILDSEAEAVFVNDGFFKLTTKKSSKEFRAWPESIHPEDYDRVMSAYRDAFSSRRELRIEFRCAVEKATDMGEWRLFLFRPLSEEKEAGSICAVVDITKIKQAQLTQEKAAAEAEDRKKQQERFIDMVSHEIRNPLSAVLCLAEEIKEISRETGSRHDDLEEDIESIIDAADTILLCVSHQNTLVDDILSFSKLDSAMLSLVPRDTRPKWEFSQALKVFNSEFKAKNIDFHYAMETSFDEQGIDWVVADLNRMKQVLVNLITNAIKFTSRKDGERKITVSMGASTERPTSYPPNVIFFDQEKSSFHIDSTMTADWGTGSTLYLMVAVKDTGIGISPQGQEKLFERFRQATPKTQEKYGGSGLGLFISRKLCQLHGGDIGVSSKEGQGSTFGFFFRVRRSDGRPAYGSRTPSETSNPPARSSTPRPGYSRSNSALPNIKEGADERPSIPERLTSHRGVESDDGNASLQNPPTKHWGETHPQSSQDDRYRETAKVSEKVETKRSSITDAIEGPMPEIQIETGETRRQKSQADKLSKSQSRHQADEKRTLLLVEDNLINQKVLRRQLQSRGFEVMTANNGQEAIEAVAERGQAREKDTTKNNYFDCILMDQEMPIKDGNAATAEIRQLQDEGQAGYSPILGVSANVREAQMQSMRDAGMDEVISKPFKVDDLVKKIRRLLPDVGGR